MVNFTLEVSSVRFHGCFEGEEADAGKKEALQDSDNMRCGDVVHLETTLTSGLCCCFQQASSNAFKCPRNPLHIFALSASRIKNSVFSDVTTCISYHSFRACVS